MKPNLLLVHSFPTNSILLHGLEEFLADYFTVHFIDLPGFHKDVKPLTGKISIQRFSDYFDKKIEELNFSNYIVGGVSFGFLVVNNAKLNNKCRGILSLEPYLNTSHLNLPFVGKAKYLIVLLLLKLVRILSLEETLWYSDWFNLYLQKQASYPKDRVDIIINHINPRTFFEVTTILLTYTKVPKFHKMPYFLVGNFADTTINFSKVVEFFIKNLHELHIASEPIEHYPKELTKSYFKSRIPEEHISRMLACING